MTETNSMGGAEAQPKIGYKNPPVKHQWAKGTSGCPSGGRKRKRSSIRAAFAERLMESHMVPNGRRKERVSYRQLIVRGMLETAASGKTSALQAIISLHEEQNADPGSPGGASVIMSYLNAGVCHGWNAMDEEFFLNEERKREVWKKEDKRRDVSFATLIDRELSRKVPAKLGGEPVMAPMQDVIVARFLSKAREGDMAIIKLLLKILPERKVKRPWRSLVLRPTQAELDGLDPKYLPNDIPKTRPDGDIMGGMPGMPDTEVQMTRI